jgi:FixJ family two-component response regulator
VLEFGLASGTASLVMDVHLGDMTGFDVHRALVAAGSRIPVIFITAHDDARTEERARQAGAAAYLRKPIRGAVLLRTIREAIAADRVT